MRRGGALTHNKGRTRSDAGLEVADDSVLLLVLRLRLALSVMVTSFKPTRLEFAIVVVELAEALGNGEAGFD